ncbi:undecaprenyl-phosphate alpha-N-acetylglucosaminyl 1-phosphate transferase [Alicyclobacillus fastidiosus]|nr:undecaprenyl-phosphate alpha-N-acetylglucosaminyl 1-phosphate transferase [Alicyclobacillus fastidiosus]
MFAGVIAVALVAFFWRNWLRTPYLGVMIGAALLFGIGILDDFFKTRGKDFSVSIRFGVQILAALLIPLFGGGIQGFTSPLDSHHYVALPTAFSVLITVLWVVGVTNVFNFLDGVDGLAAGIAAISATTLFFIAIVKGDALSAWFAIAVTGAAVGFLRHNFYPARIIMGDAGSTVLGYLLAAIASVGAFKSATVISIGVPVLALGVPIFDAVRVVLMRAKAGKPVYKPDKSHVHHHLLRAGLSQVQTVTVVYLISACFSLVSMIVLLLTR